MIRDANEQEQLYKTFTYALFNISQESHQLLNSGGLL